MSAPSQAPPPQTPSVAEPTPPPARAQRWSRLAEEELDVLVVGGGITGAGLTLDLVARGLRVALIERDDWAGATSSASSRLVHGGLRYLEQYAFGLVRESCLERALLLDNAAGLVWPERFVYPLRKGERVGRARLAAGLGLYTLVSMPRALGWPRLVGAREVARRVPGIEKAGLKGGGSYLDAATDDARLTLAVVLTALARGAIALSRAELVTLESGASGVAARVRDTRSDAALELRARAAVLCGGPFTELLRARAGLAGRWVQPTRGTHILVPRERLPTDGAVILPSPVDGRVMFLLPWPRFTAIGTTDLDADPSAEVRATRAEVRYLLDSANGLVSGARLEEADVVSTWAGLRPLLAAPESDPSARSREERVEREGRIYTIAGGKLTGYRSMAEKLGARIAHDLGRGDASAASPTRRLRLRGALAQRALRPAWSSLDATGRSAVGREPIVFAWAKRYGGLARAVEDACARAEEGRRALDPETLAGEIDWCVRHEDALSPDDFLLRRTDLGFASQAAAMAALEAVASRMARLLGWDPARTALERERGRQALERASAWRRDGDASPAS